VTDCNNPKGGSRIPADACSETIFSACLLANHHVRTIEKARQNGLARLIGPVLGENRA